jgi:uncharacterized SAM-binding protein YcdF (DUF218 family)
MLLPPGGLLLLALLGMLLLAGRRRGGWTVLGTSIGLLWLLSIQPVAAGLTRLSEHYQALDLLSPADQGRISEARAIVILGGPDDRIHAPEYENEPAASLELLERLNYGAYLSRKTSLPILVTSGSINSYTMAVSLGRDFGTPARWVDYRARDTFENASNSAAILLPSGIRTVLLVTSSTHMLRSVHEFEAAGFKVIPAPVGGTSTTHPRQIIDFIPTPDSLLRSQRALYELLGEPVRLFLTRLNIRRHAT